MLEWTIREPEAEYGPSKPRLLDQVRAAIRTRHYSYRTEEAYVGWIRRFILFHGKRHPAEMGKAEISQFLTASPMRSTVALLVIQTPPTHRPPQRLAPCVVNRCV